jgi:hypothetical protein
MEQNDRRTIGGAGLGVADVFVPGLIAGTSAGFALLDCAAAEPTMPS